MEMDKAKEKYGKECFNVVNEPIQLHHDPDLPYIYFLAIDPLHTVKLGRLKHEYVSTYQVLLCYISGAVNDVLRRLALTSLSFLPYVQDSAPATFYQPIRLLDLSSNPIRDEQPAHCRQ